MKKFFTTVGIIFFSIATTSCSRLAFTALNAKSDSDNVTRKTDIVFDKEHDLALDIYYNNNVKTSQPVVVFVYGGSWREGKKSQYRFIGSKFSEEKYITVIPDYRKYPEVMFPAFVEDVAKAIAWVKNNIAQYHGDPEKIYIMGHSAGAHIGALLIADERYLQPYNIDPDKDLAGFIGIAGGYDFIPEKEFRKVVFVKEKHNNYQDISAANFISGQEPPMLLLHGKKDKVVGIEQSYRMEKKIHAHGGNVSLKTYDKLDHINIMTELTWLGDKGAPVFSEIDRFIQNTP